MLNPAPNSRLQALLGDLRRRIRAYVLVEGIALVVALACLLFWVGYGLDVAWFAIRRLELPFGFRLIALMSGLTAIVLAVLFLLVFRLSAGFRAKALALVLERRFPQLDDRLVTAIEMSEAPPEQSTALAEAMFARTVDTVTEDANHLPLGDVFEQRRLRIEGGVALTLFGLTLLFVILNPVGVLRWFAAFFQLQDVYWERDSELRVVVVSQPGDVVKDFRDAEGRPTNGLPGMYKHPRGSELTVLVYVPNENAAGEEVVAPEPDDIFVSYTQAGRGGGDGGVFPVADASLRDRLGAQAVYRFSRGDVTGDVKLWVKGNDYTNRRPYLVEVVEAPQLDAIELACDFPAYTRTDLDVRQPVTGRTHDVPEETRFLFDAQANKPITGARIEFGQTEIVLAPSKDENGADGPIAGKVVVRSEDGAHREETPLEDGLAARFLPESGDGLRVPFVVSRQLTDAARDRAAGRFSFDAVDYGVPFLIAPNTRVSVYLSDTDGIETIDPTQITIGGIEDTPPQFVDGFGLGAIGLKITEKARIPFVGHITDDYGLASARFEFHVIRVADETPMPMPMEGDGGEAGGPVAPEPVRWRVRPFGLPPEGAPLDFELNDGDRVLSFGNQLIVEAEPNLDRRAQLIEELGRPVERFDTLPLDLKVGNKLVVTVRTEDYDDLNGPHVTRSTEYEFEIISESDLQALLYGREMDLLEQLQQVIEEVEHVRAEVEDSNGDAGRYDRVLAAGDDPDTLAELTTKLGVSAGLALDRTRTSAGECTIIQKSFERILEELSNNEVSDRQYVRNAILLPLNEANTEHFPALDRSLGAFKVGIEESNPIGDDVADAIVNAEELLATLRKVEEELQDRVSYLKAVREIKAILEQEEGLRDRTKDTRDRELIDGLGGGLGGTDDKDDATDGGSND